MTGLHLAACLEEAGLPAGVLNVVIGRGSEVGTPLVNHPAVQAISFTGSVPVGRGVRDEATTYGREHGISVIDGGCPCMFNPTADMGHKLMRLIYASHIPKTV